MLTLNCVKRLNSFQNLYARIVERDTAQNLQKQLHDNKKAILADVKAKNDAQIRNSLGMFGPNHYARHLVGNFKIYRGCHGKTGNMGIENDRKWRYPKAR